jgi:hypothetical protein
MTDTDHVASAYEKHAALLKQANALNKITVFDALAAARITRVVVTFDGEGDSGQIQEAIAYIEAKETSIPELTIPFNSAPWNATELAITESTLEETIKDLCWDYLSDQYGGWENNDGGYGEFILNVAQREIELDFYARYTDSTHYNHTF